MKEKIIQAVARGWTTKENEHKEMDADLAKAIACEVEKYIQQLLNQTAQREYKRGVKEEKERVIEEVAKMEHEQGQAQAEGEAMAEQQAQEEHEQQQEEDEGQAYAEQFR